MKKLISLVVFAIMVVLPISVKASGVSYGISCDVMDETTRTKTCEIYGTSTGSSSVTSFQATLGLTNVSVKTITAAAPWVSSSSGTNLVFKSSTAVSGTNFKIATIVFDVAEGTTSESNCKIELNVCSDANGEFTCEEETVTATPTYSCKVVNGTYYGSDGSVVTEEEYNSACVSNPQTGNFLPYAVIAAGVVLAIAVFTVSRKNNKLYKI
jgi:hypothetical protein